MRMDVTIILNVASDVPLHMQLFEACLYSNELKLTMTI